MHYWLEVKQKMRGLAKQVPILGCLGNILILYERSLFTKPWPISSYCRTTTTTQMTQNSQAYKNWLHVWNICVFYTFHIVYISLINGNSASEVQFQEQVKQIIWKHTCGLPLQYQQKYSILMFSSPSCNKVFWTKPKNNLIDDRNLYCLQPNDCHAHYFV